MAAETEPQHAGLRMLAAGLIGSGAALAAFVLWEVYAAYATPDSSRFVLSLQAHIANYPLFYMHPGAESLVVGESGAYIAAVFLFILFAWLAASVAVNLIRLGVYVLSPQVSEELRRLKQRLEAIARRP